MINTNKIIQLAMVVSLSLFVMFLGTPSNVYALECAPGYEANADDTACDYVGFPLTNNGCDPGTHLEGENCVADDSTGLPNNGCDPGTHLENGSCVADDFTGLANDGCNPGTYLVGDNCVDSSGNVSGPAPLNTVSGPPIKRDAGGSLTNPLSSTSIPDFLTKIIEVLLIFALPLIIIYIMYAGFLFVTANGNESQLTQAKNALLWSIVGGVIVLGAKIIIEVIKGTITAF